jgi:asparagine synthase (glutamine-hydrolysing)
MCGIAGEINFDRSLIANRLTIENMLKVMRHRGPDGQGVHIDGHVGLGHVRLSIIDLSTGAQPLANEDETIWITFNGEIYNYLELRSLLIAEGHQFKTRTDTEVIVHLYEKFGNECVTYLRGMFAFAIWDKGKQILFLARDRVGIKPMYYSINSMKFVFASEIKSILSLGVFSDDILPEAVDTLWCFRYLPGEITMFKDIKKLLPGHSLTVSADGQISNQEFWDINFIDEEKYDSLEKSAESLSELLKSTIRMHMISDVPVGFLLSGGVDSSAVLSYAADQTGNEISTFTIGFEGEGIVDERPFARLVAKQFNSRHYETTINAMEFWEALPQVLNSLEEPICDSATVGLHFVSKMAREHVKVLLSGEGGDEAFGGYPNYPNQLALNTLRTLCGPLRFCVGKFAEGFGKLIENRRLQEYGRLLPLELKDYYWSRAGSPFERDNGIGGIKYTEEFRNIIQSCGNNSLIERLFKRVENISLLNQMLYIDTKTWLPDYLLLKADKITMSNSIELRVPFLDHKVLEFAASLPPEFKVKRRKIKRVLKSAFASNLPMEILARKKIGFPMPQNKWLAEDLWEPTRDLLLNSNSIVRMFFDYNSMAQLIERHRLNSQFQREIFSLLTFELWHQQLKSLDL